MSLLLEALKRAEKAKDDAQRRAKGENPADDLQLEGDDAPAEGGKHVMTRDELPELSSSLEIVSDDLSVRSAPPEPEPELAVAPGAATRQAPRAAVSSRAVADDSATADRAAARKVFEAKQFREPNPKLPFYIVMGLLGAFAVGTVVYFWYELRPPSSLVVANPQRPQDEKPVEIAGSKPAAMVTAASATAPGVAPAAPSLPGLPAATPPSVPAAPAAPVLAAAAKPAAAKPAPAVRAVPAKPAASTPAAARSFTRAAGRNADVKVKAPQAHIHPRVTAGFAAYQAGNYQDARSAYLAALQDEPENRDALLGMAAVELREGRAAPAETYYRRVLYADPRNAHAQAGLLALQAPLLDPVAAESRIKSLLAANPDAKVLYFALGNQYAQQLRWAEAQQAYFKALAADPENPDFAFNLAVSLDQLRQKAQALRYYRSALALAAKRSASFDPAAIRARVQVLER